MAGLYGGKYFRNKVKGLGNNRIAADDWDSFRQYLRETAMTVEKSTRQG
ncbi:MAG: hypothetical protein LBB83_00775 [Treponema sp.]|nr:hypothetical protein [Treponema sp.]